MKLLLSLSHLHQYGEFRNGISLYSFIFIPLQGQESIAPVRLFISTESKHVVNNNNNDNKQIVLGWNPRYHPLCSPPRQEEARQSQEGGLLVCSQRAHGGSAATRPLEREEREAAGSPQRDGEEKWVTVCELCPAVVGPNIQQMCRSSAR